MWCGPLPYQNRQAYSTSLWESHQHTRVADVKSSTVFVGVPHQLCAYTATTDKSVLGKSNVHSYWTQSGIICIV